MTSNSQAVIKMFGISNTLRHPDAHRLISSMNAKLEGEQEDRVLRVPRETQRRREQRGSCQCVKNEGYVWRALPGRGSCLAVASAARFAESAPPCSRTEATSKRCR